MPMYDRICKLCGLLKEDCLEPIGRTEAIECDCGGPLVRTIATGKFHKSTGITPDLIPGGIEIKHGICNPDGTPRRYDSKSEMRRVAREMGVENVVRHVPNRPDSDKNPHTSRWVSAPVITEEERVAHMRSLYADEGIDLDHLPDPVDPAPNTVIEGNVRVREIIAKAVHEHITLDNRPYSGSEYAHAPEFRR